MAHDAYRMVHYASRRHSRLTLSDIMAHFRFEDLNIWRLACELAAECHNVAARLEKAGLYRYAEQLRAAGLSVSNNIAEGSGSLHSNEFRQFLNIAPTPI